MTNPAALVRSLITYAICVGLALTVGYMLATPTDFVSFFMVVIVLSMLLVPILLRWHYAWLVLSWNMAAMVFFLPGRPTIGMLMIAVSLLLSLLQHIMNRNFKFTHVPAITWPLIFLTLVVLVTARMRGGGGLAIFGSSNIGGRRYLAIYLAVAGFFALVAHRIPQEKVKLFVGMYFLSALTLAITHLAGFLGGGLQYIYLVFPIDPEGLAALHPDAVMFTEQEAVRWGGLAFAGSSILSVLLAFYGVRGIFNVRYPWRMLAFLATWASMLVGGYRSFLLTGVLTFAAVFWLEGLMRSRLLPAFLLIGVLCAVLVVPFSTSMPYMVQRTLSFLPFVKVDSAVQLDVEASNEWRLDVWGRVVKEVPKYLAMGKGLSIDAADFAQVQNNAAASESGEASEMAGDYHSGPLSLIIPFGVLGVIGFFWLLWAGMRVMYLYYRDGDPELRQVNTLLLAALIAKLVMFLVVVGTFYSDLIYFTGLIGLAVAINGPVPVRVRVAKARIAAPARSSAVAYADAAR